MDKKKIENIKNLACYPEWSTFMEAMNGWLDKLNRLDMLNIDEKVSVEAQVIGKQWMIRELRLFLSQINVLKDAKLKDKTYE